MLPIIVAGALGVISLITLLLYAVDKIKSKTRARRISEKTLLCFSFFGGAVGGSLGMLLVRHKTRHWYFVAVNVLGLIWQIGLVTYLFMSF